MKLYMSKSNTPRDLDQYIGKDVWVKTEYHDHGRSKTFTWYYVRILREESNSYGDFYICNFCNAPLVLPYRRTQEQFDRIVNRTMRFKKSCLVPAKPLNVLSVDDLFEIEG